MNKTPRTDQLVKSAPYGDCRNDIWSKAIALCRELEADNARLREDVLRWFAYIDPFELVDDDRKHFERWREEQARAAESVLRKEEAK